MNEVEGGAVSQSKKINIIAGLMITGGLKGDVPETPAVSSTMADCPTRAV